MARALSLGEPDGECCTAEEIAAMVDGVLKGEESERVAGHLASCSKCLETFTLAQELSDTAQITEKSSHRSWYLAGGGLAVAVAAVLAVKLTLTAPGPPGTTSVRQQQSQQIASVSPHPASPAATGSGGIRSDHKSRASGAGAAAVAVLTLLTDEEAARPAAKNYGFSEALKEDGPAISAKDLEISGAEPFQFSIAFTPRDRVEVDLSTLKITCTKADPIDLTPRLQTFATAKGIFVDKTILPEGLYRFRVGIGDYQGRLSQKEFTLNVSYKY